MLQVLARDNYFTNGGKAVIFRSKTTSQVDYDGLIKRMLQYNSTITEGDVRSVLTVFATILIRLTAEGNTVKTPFGNFYACASGTCDSVSDAFEPEKTDNDHSVDLHFKTTSQARKQLLSDLEFERTPAKYVTVPFISEVRTVDNITGKEKNTENTFSAGSILSIKGLYLHTDASDSLQGVYLISQTDETNQVQCTYFTRNTKNTVRTSIPAGITEGTYKLKIVTKPGKNRYETCLYKDVLKIA